MAIFARLDGWLIAVRVIRETRAGTHVRPIDSTRPMFIRKADITQKLFDRTEDAIAFVGPGLPA